MSETTIKNLLRRWASAKHIAKSQLEELLRDGYIITLDNGEHRLSDKGIILINRKDLP